MPKPKSMRRPTRQLSPAEVMALWSAADPLTPYTTSSLQVHWIQKSEEQTAQFGELKAGNLLAFDSR